MTSIAYAENVVDARQQRVAGWFLRTAVVLGVVPMVLGVGIVALYWATYWEVLVTAGLIMLPVGTGIMVLGLSFWIVWAVMERRAKGKARFRRKVYWLTPLLLVSNVGVGVGCAVAGNYLYSRTVVEVINETGVPIDGCTIDLPDGRNWTAESIPPAGCVRREGMVWGEGAITLTLQQGKISSTSVVEGYITFGLRSFFTHGRGTHSRVHVKAGLASNVEHLK